MSNRLVENYTFADLKKFAQNKKVPRRTVMKTQEELADLLVRGGYVDKDVREFMSKLPAKRASKRATAKRASAKKRETVSRIASKIVNPETGRLILIGGKKYEELVKLGKIRA